MTVILDTNQLPQNGSSETLQLQVLRAVCAEHGVGLAAPELVFVEWASKVRRDATASWQKAQSALRAAARFGPVPELQRLDGAATASAQRARLEQLIEVLPMPGGCWEEALRREADRVPPAREGSGGRDAAIWLAALDHARQQGEMSYLVTANTKDFADPEGRISLHPKLAEEAGNPPLIELVTGSELMLARLATESEAALSVEVLREMTSASAAVAGALETGLLDDLDIPPLEGTGDRYFASPPELAPEQFSDQRSYSVEGTPVGLIATTYHVNAVVGGLRRRHGVGMSQVQADVRVELPVRLWVRGDDEGAECELISVDPPRLVAAA